MRIEWRTIRLSTGLHSTQTWPIKSFFACIWQTWSMKRHQDQRTIEALVFWISLSLNRKVQKWKMISFSRELGESFGFQSIFRRWLIGKYHETVLCFWIHSSSINFTRRDKGVVSPVRSQGSCGACWAISVVDTISSISAIKRQQNFSELCLDQVINCAGNGNFGCEGGDTCRLLEWLKEENIKLNTMQQCETLKGDKDGSNCTFQQGRGDFLSLDQFSCVR